MFEIHHIAISVSNLEKSEKFYNIFGFKRKFYWQSENKNLEIMHLKLNDFILELFCFKELKKLSQDSKKIETDLPKIGVKHFGLQVENLEKIKEKFLKEKLAENIEIKTGRTKIKYFFINDPDGILIEFVEDNRKFN